MASKAMRHVFVSVVGVRKGERKEKNHNHSLGDFPADCLPENLDIQATAVIAKNFRTVKTATLNLWVAELTDSGSLLIEIMSPNNEKRLLVG